MRSTFSSKLSQKEQHFPNEGEVLTKRYSDSFGIGAVQASAVHIAFSRSVRSLSQPMSLQVETSYPPIQYLRFCFLGIARDLLIFLCSVGV